MISVRVLVLVLFVLLAGCEARLQTVPANFRGRWVLPDGTTNVVAVQVDALRISTVNDWNEVHHCKARFITVTDDTDRGEDGVSVYCDLGTRELRKAAGCNEDTSAGHWRIWLAQDPAHMAQYMYVSQDKSVCGGDNMEIPLGTFSRYKVK